jgi:hypothetical protein
MTSTRGPNWPLLAMIAACVILAAPLWCVVSPAMPDYPAHLASFYLITGGASHYYYVEWAFLPNLASEIIVPAITQFIPLEPATKVFLTITVMLWVIGPAAVQRALRGRVGVESLLAGAFTYNATFMWGFFNYEFATGLSFLVLAAWIATEDRRGPLLLAGFAAAFTLVYFSHLFALATLTLIIGSFEATKLWRSGERSPERIARPFAVLGLLNLPAAVLFFALKPPGTGSLLQFNLLDTMGERFEAAIAFSFDQPAYAVTAAIVVLFIAGVVTRRIAISRRMGPALLLLALCTIFAPEWAMGGWGVHFRLPAVLGALTLASSQFELSDRWLKGGVAATLILFLFQASVLTLNWQRIDARYREFRAVANRIEPDARLLTVLDGDSLGWSADQPYWHMAEFAVVDRGVFTPLVFTTRGQHIIRIGPPMDRFAAASAQQGSPPDIDELNDLAAGRRDADEDIRDVLPYLLFFQCHYDEAVVIHGDGPLSRVPPMLRLRYTGSFFALYDVMPDEMCKRQ